MAIRHRGMIAAVVIVTLTLVSLIFSHSMVFAAQEFEHEAELAAVVSEVTSSPSDAPSPAPSSSPSSALSSEPTAAPTSFPSKAPTPAPTEDPTASPTSFPEAELAAVVSEMTAWTTSKKKTVTYEANKRDAAAAAGNVVSVAMSFEPMLSTWIQQHYLYQRNPEYMSLVADKVKVKDIVSRLSLPGVFIPKTLWAGPKCSDLTLERLPASYVIKPNHSSGKVIRIKEGIDLATKQPVSLQRVRGLCEEWLAVNYGVRYGEKWYTEISPQILVEEWVDDGHSSTHDHKIHVINNRVAMIWCDYGRYETHVEQFFDANWNRLGVSRYQHLGDVDIQMPRPVLLEDMLNVALKLAEPFPYVRVDLYTKGGAIYFSELTFAPDAGRSNTYSPSTLDNVLGYMIAHPGGSNIPVLEQSLRKMFPNTSLACGLVTLNSIFGWFINAAVLLSFLF